MSLQFNKNDIQHLHLILKHFGFDRSFESNSELVVQCSDATLEVLEACHFTVKKPLDDPMIVKNSFVNECSIAFEITGYNGRSMSESFFDIQKIFDRTAAIERNHPALDKVEIRFTGGQWFSEKLLSAHLNVMAKSIFYATIVQHFFYAHWTVRSNLNVISTDFEYDRERIICNFYQTENGPRKEDSTTRERGRTNYELSVPFKNVHKIMVDEYTPDTLFLIHFVLYTPSQIRKTKFGSPEENKYREIQIYRDVAERKSEDIRSSPKAITESPVFTTEIRSSREEVYMVLSRLHSRMRVPIEFSKVEHLPVVIGSSTSPFHKKAFLHDYREARRASDCFILRDLCGDLRRSPIDPQRWEVPYSDALVDECIYMVEALLSRGGIVKCQLLPNETEWNKFRGNLSRFFFTDPYACLQALKEIISFIDENVLIDCLQESFAQLFIEKRGIPRNFGLSEEEEKEGYVFLRKIIITPTRMILMPSEVVMGNRAVRFAQKTANKHNAFLRVWFRDDDLGRLRSWGRSNYLIRQTVNDSFNKGIIITGNAYYYIGSSSSQQREHGAYFMIGVLDSHTEQAHRHQSHMFSIEKFRKKLGRFEHLSIPKLMARLGQCFTQSRETEVRIRRENYCRNYDIIGGSDAKNQSYVFSDGVGTISYEFANKIRQDLSFESIPGCFQIRFRGMKGVLSVDNFIDERNFNLTSNEVHQEHLLFKFRHSQEKFVAKRYDEQPIEIVKCSGVTPMFLNKPLISVLDFASETNKTLHDRIGNRIRYLLDSSVQQMAQQLSSDFHCRQTLKSFPKRINVDLLDKNSGLDLIMEPFFRGLLLANSYDSIAKHRQKLRIPIPNHLARGMMGVLDETGRLQSGQVFFQYTSSCAQYNPTRLSASIIHTGPVMITKSPTTVLGDLRVFEAVDISELRHLRDVIVFPQHGPRPHPDEMAGSDLDGDEYSVIWDPELLLDENVPAKSYDSSLNASQVNVATLASESEKTLNETCAEFFFNVITQDAIGHISNCHLFNSDAYHITSEVCESLATKASIALDFAKTGVPATSLTRQWRRDDNNVWCPPESVEYYPDYSGNRTIRPVYCSSRWIGELFREVKKIEEFVSDELKDVPSVEIDPLMIEEQWEDYEADATSTFNCYLNELRSIMITYRVRNESDLFAGIVRDYNQDKGGKSGDDQSFYNIKQVVDQRVTNLFRNYRQHFFEEFGGHARYTHSKYRYHDSPDVLKRHVVKATPEMKRKASAYYHVAYKHAMETGERFLSFGWLLYDINADTRLTKILQSQHTIVPAMRNTDSLTMRVQSACERTLSSRGDAFALFTKEMKMDTHLQKYVTKYRGFNEILFVLREWARNENVLEGRFTEKHLLHLFLAFVLNRFATKQLTFYVPFEEIHDDTPMEDLEEGYVVLEEPYKLLLSFFEFTCSSMFKKLENINFSSTGYKSVLLRGEWKVLYEKSLKCFYKLLISLKFVIDPVDGQDDTSQNIYDENPFCMLVPESNHDDISEKLKKASGVVELSARVIQDDVMIILARGTSAALRKLKDIAMVRKDKYYAANSTEADQLHQYIMTKTMEKLQNY